MPSTCWPPARQGEWIPGTHLVGLGRPEVIVLGGSFRGHLSSDSRDVEQEVPEELDGAEPEREAKHRVTQLQGAVRGSAKLRAKRLWGNAPEIFKAATAEWEKSYRRFSFLYTFPWIFLPSFLLMNFSNEKE